MVLIFDLDDTLYEEIRYVQSGFRAVAAHLQARYALDAAACYEAMLGTLEERGRGAVFNAILDRHGLLSKGRVRECVSVYRLHSPDIQLPDVSLRCLQRFADLPKYVVTDGNKEVQARKVAALGVEQYLRKALLTGRYGNQHAKPSPYCFQKIIQREHIAPQQAVYIGDNPHKDFVGIKPLGFKTIRIRQGMFAALSKSAEYEADVEIQSLDELTVELLHRLGLS